MDRHGLRKKHGQVSHQVVKQLVVDPVVIFLQSISIHLHISLALDKHWVADCVTQMFEDSRSTASPATSVVDTSWSSKLMEFKGKWVAVPISQKCELWRCFGHKCKSSSCQYPRTCVWGTQT